MMHDGRCWLGAGLMWRNYPAYYSIIGRLRGPVATTIAASSFQFETEPSILTFSYV